MENDNCKLLLLCMCLCNSSDCFMRLQKINEQPSYMGILDLKDYGINVMNYQFITLIPSIIINYRFSFSPTLKHVSVMLL